MPAAGVLRLPASVTAATVPPKQPRPPFHVMTKPAGAVCNLACDYCFYLDKESLYPAGPARMGEDLLRRYLEQLFAGHDDRDEVVVAFQGGEPTLLGLDYYRRAAALARQLARPGQQVLMTLQTNGTLIDDDWAAFLAEEDVLVGISIDGPQWLHDRYRVDRGGKPSYRRVRRGLDALRRHGVRWNALTCVHAGNGDHGRVVYRHLRDDLGCRYLQLIPIVENDGAAAGARSVRPEQYGRFLIDVFEDWVRRDVGDVFVTMFDTSLARWLGLDDVGSCVQAPTCGAAVALEHTGDVYSCDHFVDTEHLLGSITGTTLRALLDDPRQRVRAAQAHQPPGRVPDLPGAVRLPRRLPEGPVRHHRRRRAARPGAELPVRRLPGVLRPHRPHHAATRPPGAHRPGSGRDPAGLRARRRRPPRRRRVHLRIRSPLGPLPWRPGAIAG